MTHIIKSIINIREGIVLVEYSSTGHPELIFYKILNGWRERGMVPLIVDIGDTLHIFLQNLRLAGINLSVEDIPVVKERGITEVGNVLGHVDVIEDFDHHLAMYSRLVRRVPENVRKRTVVLGMEKFSFTFMDNPPKLERYFETVTRRYLSMRNRVSFLFLNKDAASEYLRKGLEQDSDYVLGIEGREVQPLKSAGVVG